MASDSEVDRLYQVPLGEFTAARNELAKAHGKAGGAIRRLQKPSLSAWAVNQLYWHRNAAYEALVAAARTRREAHAKVLSGKKADLAGAEQAWQQASREASAVVRQLLESAGESATPATLIAVGETLQALPSDDPPGRLTRPLKPAGFEALAGMRISGRKGKVPAPPISLAPSVTVTPSATSKKAAAARRRELAALKKTLVRIRKAEKAATGDLEDARTALEKAQAERERLQDQLQFALKQIQDRRDAIGRLDLKAREAAAELERAEQRVRDLESAD